MKRTASVLVSVSMMATTASATPATVTAAVNLRSGPGTGYDSVGRVPEGGAVDVTECDESGAWCAVKFSGSDGFVSGRYIQRSDPHQAGWPRSFTTEKGATVTFFQPQIVDWPGFTELDALVATEVVKTGAKQPVYGVIGIRGRTVADDTADEVVLTDITASKVDFSTLGRQELADLAIEVGKLLPTGPVTVSQDRLTASLADYQRLNDATSIKSDPPRVVTRTKPAILFMTDGREVRSPVKGVEGLEFVVNTNWDVFKTGGRYYLRDGKSWLTSDQIDGAWTAVDALPDPLTKLPDEESWKDARSAVPAAPFADAPVPEVVYSDVPAEMLLFDGEPRLEGVPGTKLEWASNTTGDVFFHTGMRTWYVLLSGRWFSASSLDGPWTFATPDLPDDFRNIPEDAPYYQVRASVPGTSESAEARLKASVPQMARVSTDGSVKVDVVYSGDPKFEPIEGTSLSYAVNSNDQIVKVGDAYFVLKDGVWFTGTSPTGPWTVATAVPEAIYTIPPSSPVYNATYVRVYQSEPDAVWFGYTMGYLGAYLAWDTFVYGTGWAYPAYWDFGWAGGYWPYYPRPVTYGVGAFYNPVYGTFGRYGYAYGPYRGIAGGAAYNPRTGTYARGGVIAGPNGDRGFVAAFNPRTGTAAFAKGGHNVYGSWGTAGVRHGSDFARISGGATDNAAGARWRTSDGNRGFLAGRDGGDIYAGRNGNVYRKDDGSWQKHTADGWKPVERPSAENIKTPGEHIAARHPNLAQKIRSEPVSERRADLANRAESRPTPTKRTNATERGADRGPAPAWQNSAARQVRERVPDHVAIDRVGRHYGNQRELRNEFGRVGGGNFGGREFGGRSGGFRGGGGFHGGGRFRR